MEIISKAVLDNEITKHVPVFKYLEILISVYVKRVFFERERPGSTEISLRPKVGPARSNAVS
jgi:hypothetical protein